MPASPIRKLMPYAIKAKAEGVEVLHLNIGQPDIHTPVSALEAIRQFDSDVIAYGPSEGRLEVRQIMCQYYTQEVSPITTEQLMITTGASEAIHFALQSCFDAGDELIVPEPFYANYLGFALSDAVQIVPITCERENDFALPDTATFESKITSKTRGILICNPCNPTGTLYDRAQLEDLARLVKKHDLFLIVDEVYREFCFDQPFHSALNLEDMESHVIIIDSVSKVFSSCGSRIGCLVSRNEKVMQTALKYAQMRLSPPAIGQTAAAAAYQNRANYIQEVKHEYDSRRLYAHSRLAQMKDVKTYLPLAAFYVMVDLPVDDITQFCIWMLEEFRHEGRTVMLAPGDGFYFTPGLGRREARLAYVLDNEKLAHAMDVLERAIEQYPGRL